jgi:hypothetical protein
MIGKRACWSFGLRPMMVVLTLMALPLGWAGYQLHWIRERHEFLYRGNWTKAPSFQRVANPEFAVPPFSLRFFGEKGNYLEFIYLSPEATSTELARIQRLFPEKRVLRRPERWILSNYKDDDEMNRREDEIWAEFERLKQMDPMRK